MTSRSAEPPQLKHLEMFRGIAAERLTRLNLQWVQLEQNLAGEEAVSGMLRELHTLKGEASMMGFPQLVAILHGLEELLSAQAAGAPADALTGDLVLRTLDMVSAAVDKSTDAPAAEAAELLTTLGQPRNNDPEPASVHHPVRREAARPAPLNRENSVRVTSAKLDRVRDTISELMLTQARLALSAGEFRKVRQKTQDYKLQLTATSAPAAREFTMLLDAITGLESRLRDDNHRFAALVAELDVTTRELRMVPIRALFEQYPVAMRELGRELGREVRLEFHGEAVEIDRSVLDRLAEPLLHLLRNALDHGIEPPEVRRLAGKLSEGTVKVQAKLNGRLIELTVHDDGAGIDAKAVQARAIELGLITPVQASHLSEQQVLRMLFHAHMSTRRQVTKVSGRGLGLSVVQSAVEGLGGTVAIDSTLGGGTTFRLSVPVSLALSSVMLFEVGTARYALPAAAVAALVEAAEHPVIASISGPTIRYAGVLIPLLRLDELVGELDDSPARAEHGESARLLVVIRGGELLALQGTHHHSEREVVLKSTGRFFAKNRLINAVIPQADGTLALVLSLSELHPGPHRGPTAAAPAVAARRKTVLVVDDSPVVRDLLAEALRAHGLQVIEAGDGEEALQKLQSGPSIDLVVTDVDMPKLDGIGLLQQLRQSDRPRRLPVVMVSMRGSPEDQRRALAAGADAYLVKTDLSHAGLWTMLARYLE